MKEKILCNDVVLLGTIVHKFETEKVTILTISTGKNAAGVINYPKVVFFNDVDTAEYEQYDRVIVTGNVQSSRRKNGEKTFVSQSIYGESIKEAPRVMESFGINEGAYKNPINEVKLAGEVLDIAEPSKGVVRILLKTVKNGRTSNVQMFDFTRNSSNVVENIKKGDNVCVIANVQTTKKERDGETAYYENIVIQNIEKVEE